MGLASVAPWRTGPVLLLCACLQPYTATVFPALATTDIPNRTTVMAAARTDIERTGHAVLVATRSRSHRGIFRPRESVAPGIRIDLLDTSDRRIDANSDCAKASFDQRFSLG